MEDTAKITFEAADRLLPKIEEINGIPFGLLPPNSSLEELDNLLPHPKFTRQNVVLQDQDSFIKYVNAYDDKSIAAVFFDRANLQFKAVLDYHTPAEANHGYHTATFKMAPSLERNAWDRVLNRPLRQGEWIEFLEDRDVDFINPTPSEIISVIKDFQVQKNSRFKSTQILESGDVDLRYSTDTQPTGQTIIPRSIILSIPLFEGDEPVELKGRFRYSVKEGNLTIRIVIPRLHDLIRQRADDVAQIVKNGAGAPLYLGAIK